VQSIFRKRGIDFIPVIMPWTVFNVSNQPLTRAVGTRKFLIQNSTNGFDNVQIFAWLTRANAISLPRNTMRDDFQERLGVVVDKQPGPCPEAWCRNTDPR
jgi:hypothetical protein